jgi:hypothetical protein
MNRDELIEIARGNWSSPRIIMTSTITWPSTEGRPYNKQVLIASEAAYYVVELIYADYEAQNVDEFGSLAEARRYMLKGFENLLNDEEMLPG